jgi:hypothetical protein
VSIKRWAARTDSNQAEIVAVLRAAGCSVWIIGLPVDLLVGLAGRTVLVEVKTTTGKKKPRQAAYTPLQQGFLADWRGGPISTVTDVPGALALAAMLRNSAGRV